MRIKTEGCGEMEILGSKAQYICHPDFENLKPIQVFHKEFPRVEVKVHGEEFCNRHILYRKKIVLDDFKTAVLRITADDYYKLYINGQFVTQGPAASYPQAYFYNEIDISDYLVNGENVFAIHTYYQGLINRVWVSGDLRQMLWCSLDIDGKEVLCSDESWKCTNHTAYHECGQVGYKTAYLEHYDSNAPEISFYLSDYDDSEWGFARIYQNADYVLQKQPTKQLDFYVIPPREQKKTKHGLFVDFGFEAVGYLQIKAKGNKGDIVTLRCSEELDDSGCVRYRMRCNCKYEEFWTLSGAEDTLMQFDYKAFRYSELLFPDSVEIVEVSMLVRHYPYEQKTTYHVKHKEMEQILKLCADTIKYGTQENYVDCPTREKGQYLGDVSIAGRAQATVTQDATMMKKAIMDFCESTFICPGVMTVSSSSFMQEIADYSLQFPAQICWVYSIDKDIEFLKQTEPYVTALYQYFLKYCNEKGLLEKVTEKWNLVDWPENLRDGYDFPLTKPIGEGVHNVLNAFWYGFLQSVDEIYGLLGMPLTGKTKQVEQAFIDTFYSEETGVFVDSPTTTHSAVQSNVLPLLFDIGTKDMELKQRMIDFIMKKGLTSMGVYMAYFALAALVKHGEVELAEQLTLDQGGWKLMLKQGGTTTFEAWGKEQKWNTSLFHPWATAPLIVFADGVRPY